MDNQVSFGTTRISNLLNGISFFDVFTPDELDKLIEIGEWFNVASGKRIIIQGDFDNYLYILVQGQVEIILGNKILGALKSGDIFGEFGLIGTMRTASVEATEECILMAFKGDNLDNLPPDLQVKFLKQIIHVICTHMKQINKSLWFRAPIKDI